MKTFTCLLSVAFLSIALHTHAQTGSRLMAWAAYNNFYISDSAYYTYTGSNGGDLTHLLNFSNETIYGYNPNAGADSFYTYEAVQQTFNSNDYIIGSLTQFWDTTKWVNEWRTLFNYNANNLDTLAFYQTWDTSKWLGNQKTYYHYTNNKIDTVTIEDASYLGGYTGYTKNSFAYNSSGYVTDEVLEYWNLLNNNWKTTANQQLIYNYDAFNNDTAFVIQEYDTAGTGKWVNQYKVVYTYDANHNPLTEVELVWDTTTLDTTSKLKTSYNYDANSNDTSDVTLHYDYTQSKWDTDITNSYTYNIHNQVTYHASYNSNLFVPYMETHYYYQDYTTGIKQLTVDNGQLTVYPNPSSNFIHVDLTLQQSQPVQLSLYNILGQQVWYNNLGTIKQTQATVPVTNLAEGVYVLRVNKGGAWQQKEVIVAR